MRAFIFSLIFSLFYILSACTPQTGAQIPPQRQDDRKAPVAEKNEGEFNNKGNLEHSPSMDEAGKFEKESASQANFKHSMGSEADFESLIRDWDTARNARDALLLSKLFCQQSYTHGRGMSREGVAQYIGKAFEKHSDYSQKILSPEPRVERIREDLYSIRLRKEFTQSGRTIETEVLLILQREESGWCIANETDDSLDRNILRKVGFETKLPKNPSCADLLRRILFESPYFRFQIMRQWEAAKKSKVTFRLDVSRQGVNYELNLIEVHDLGQRELIQERYTYFPESQSLKLYDVADDDWSVEIPLDGYSGMKELIRACP